MRRSTSQQVLHRDGDPLTAHPVDHPNQDCQLYPAQQAEVISTRPSPTTVSLAQAAGLALISNSTVPPFLITSCSMIGFVIHTPFTATPTTYGLPVDAPGAEMTKGCGAAGRSMVTLS